MPGRCRQLVSRLFLCVAFFFDAVKYIRQGVRRRCVCRTDETCVYIRGCACLGVAQTARYGGNGNMSCYKQAGVGVAQAVEVNRREIVGFQKFGKPCCDRAGVYGLAVPLVKSRSLFTVLPSISTLCVHSVPTFKRSRCWYRL